MILAPLSAIPARPVLRDIHVPQASWWPPASGWWILLVLLVASLLLLAWLLRRWRRRRQLRNMLLSELDKVTAAFAQDQDGAALAAGLSSLLRRAARLQGAEVHLAGAAWRDEVQRLAPDALSPAFVRVLQSAPYQRSPEFDAEGLLAACRRWLLESLRGRDERHA